MYVSVGQRERKRERKRERRREREGRERGGEREKICWANVNSISPWWDPSVLGHFGPGTHRTWDTLVQGHNDPGTLRGGGSMEPSVAPSHAAKHGVTNDF